MDPDVEVVVGQAAGDAHPDHGHEVAGDLHPEVRRMRQEVVVSSLHGGHGSADEAVGLHAAHREATEGVVVSALLVCTHRRFARCSRTFMRRLEGGDVLDDDHLDVPAAGRRWAARRLVEGGHLDVGSVLVRIDQRHDGAGGAALSGVLDAWECSPPEDLQCPIDLALGSSLASVRRRAQDVLARRDPHRNS